MLKIISGIIESRRLAVAVLVASSMLLIIYTVVITVLRINLPAQLDVYEGKVLCQAIEFSLGNKIYRDPSKFGAADMYTPVYVLLLGSIHRLAEPSFFWGRLLSAFASLLTGLLILWYYYIHSKGNKLLMVIIAALFSGIAWHTAWFYSALKTDALSHLMWLIGLGVLANKPQNMKYSAIAAVILALAFFVKQTALFALPGAVLFLLLERRRNAVVFITVYIASWTCLLYVLMGLSGEWLPQFIFNRMSTQAGGMFPFARLFHFFFSLNGTPLIMVGALASVALFGKFRHITAYRLAFLSLPFMLGGSVLTASSTGGSYNSMLPAYITLLFIAGFSICELLERFPQRAEPIWLLALLMAFQIDPMTPYNISKARGSFDQDFVQTVEFLQKQSGSMYAPSHNVLTLLAGRPLFDDRVLAGYISKWAPEAAERIVARVNSGEFDLLVMARHEDDMAMLAPETVRLYEVAADFGSWIVLQKSRTGML